MEQLKTIGILECNSKSEFNIFSIFNKNYDDEKNNYFKQFTNVDGDFL